LLANAARSRHDGIWALQVRISKKQRNSKKWSEAKKRHTSVDVREIKIRCKVEEHDYQVNLRCARDFLAAGGKIKLLITLKERELQHKALTIELTSKFLKDLDEFAILDTEAHLKGRSVIMILSPNPQRIGRG
jgi:translation initiation factor IF-3